MSRTVKKYHRTLTIAGSDSGGGAGIQADLKTFSALGCYGMSAVTALTAQNTTGVSGIHEISPSFVADQIDAVIDDIGVDAVKIGMLHNVEVIEAVADRLQYHKVEPVVLDPVMVAQSGDKLLKDSAVQALKTELFPVVSLITPNLPEAEVLLGRRINDEAELEESGEVLMEYGAAAVLVKGGHLRQKQSVDILFYRNSSDGRRQIRRFMSPRIETSNTHGTGCTLSSAIAAWMARGEPLPQAVEKSKEYITGAIRAGSRYKIGRGNGPLHHFFRVWNNDANGY